MSIQYSIEELASDPAINGAAQCYYQADRMEKLKSKYPKKNQQELITIAINEWNQKVNINKKTKYFRVVEKMGLVKLKLSPPFKRTILLTEILKKEPKKPPKNGYSLFTSEQLAKYVNVEPQKRMTEVARIWKEVVSKEEKEQFDARNKLLLAQYQKDLQDFIQVINHK
jgi:transcription factor protein